jgi:hypothetical protein
MGNHWLIIDEIEALRVQLSHVFAPYLNAYFSSSNELLDTMTKVQNDFLQRNRKYLKYIHWVRTTFTSTKFKKDDKEIWRFDDYNIVSIY